MIRCLLMCVVCAALAVMAGAAFASESEAESHWQAPPKEAARPNPLAGTPELAAGGGKLFARRCASCHGEDGRGIRNAPSLRTRTVQEQTDGALFWKISTGNTRGGMPSFSSLPEKQRWQIVLFLRTLAGKDAK